MLWGAEAELGEEFGNLKDVTVSTDSVEKMAAMNVLGTKILPEMVGFSELNTTIGVVATDAPISKAQAKRLAMSSHDGLSRAIRPAHMPMDGDTLFALSTAQQQKGPSDKAMSVDPIGMSMLSATGANCVERAIVHAVLNATTAYETPSWKEAAGYDRS